MVASTSRRTALRNRRGDVVFRRRGLHRLALVRAVVVQCDRTSRYSDQRWTQRTSREKSTTYRRRNSARGTRDNPVVLPAGHRGGDPVNQAALRRASSRRARRQLALCSAGSMLSSTARSPEFGSRCGAELKALRGVLRNERSPRKDACGRAQKGSPRCMVCTRGLVVHLTGLNTVWALDRRNYDLGRHLRTGEGSSVRSTPFGRSSEGLTHPRASHQTAEEVFSY